MTHYAYLVCSMIFLVIWLAIFLARRDLRGIMWPSSILVAVFGTIMDYFVWRLDWWTPANITGTPIGLEDIIFGFSLGGIMAVIYLVVMRVGVHGRTPKIPMRAKILSILLLFASGGVLNVILDLRSWTSWAIALLVPIPLVLYYRKDLAILGVASGLIITLLSVPIYIIMFAIDPAATLYWHMQFLTGSTVFQIPIEDLIWFFTAGMFIGTVWLFLFDRQIKTEDKH